MRCSHNRIEKPAFSGARVGSTTMHEGMVVYPSKCFHNGRFPSDDQFGGNCFKKRGIRGPAVRGRAGGCTETATSYNTGFAASVAKRSLRQTLARSQRLLRKTQPLRPHSGFANPGAVMRNRSLGSGGASCAAEKQTAVTKCHFVTAVKGKFKV